MRKLSKAALALSLSCVVACGSNAVANPLWSGFIVYWDAASGLREAAAAASQWDALSNFSYQFDDAGAVIPADDALSQIQSSLQATSGRHGKLLTSLVNDTLSVAKDPTITHRVLTEPSLRAASLSRLQALAAATDGIDIDFERLQARDRNAYTTYIRDLATLLHGEGKWLAVTVEAKTSDTIKDGPGAVDWRAIAAWADEIKIMCYYFHWNSSPPGAVCPPSWLAQLTNFALNHEGVPAEKLSMILPTYGYDWPAGGQGQQLEHVDAWALANHYGASWQRDAEDDPYFTYTDAQGVSHQVWTEDKVSLLSKINQLQAAGVARIAFWRLGAGDPSFWQWLSQAAPATPAPPPVVSLPSAPTQVVATPGDGQATIQWAAVPGATSYNLYRSRYPGVTPANGFEIVGAVSPYLNTGWINGTAYYMVVTAVNAAGESAPSAEAVVVPAAPQPPRAPSYVIAIPGDGQATIQWAPVLGATSYNLYRSRFPGVTPANGYKIAGADTPYLNTGWTNGTTYYMVVTAVNAAGESVPSTEAAVVPRAFASSPTGALKTSATASCRVYPNPWRSDRHSALAVTFDHLPRNASVKLFTLAGQWIRTLTADPSDTATWNLTNHSGERVASGLYLYLITSDAQEPLRGKLAIIR